MWCHYDVITSKIIIFETKKWFHCVPRWIFYMIEYDFTPHHMVYGKLLDETYNIYAKSDKNDQKWRHYDVITPWKISFKKFQYNFQNPRKISNQIGEVIFCLTLYSRLKTAKSAFIGDFTIFPLLNPYFVTNFSFFVGMVWYGMWLVVPGERQR